jgi:hypothetical protein
MSHKKLVDSLVQIILLKKLTLIRFLFDLLEVIGCTTFVLVLRILISY